MKVMLLAIKLMGIVLYVLAMWLGVPLLLVETIVLGVAKFGDTWQTGVLLTCALSIEFCGAIAFMSWHDNPILDWLLGERITQ